MYIIYGQLTQELPVAGLWIFIVFTYFPSCWRGLEGTAAEWIFSQFPLRAYWNLAAAVVGFLSGILIVSVCYREYLYRKGNSVDSSTFLLNSWFFYFCRKPWTSKLGCLIPRMFCDEPITCGHCRGTRFGFGGVPGAGAGQVQRWDLQPDHHDKHRKDRSASQIELWSS